MSEKTLENVIVKALIKAAGIGCAIYAAGIAVVVFGMKVKAWLINDTLAKFKENNKKYSELKKTEE